MPDLKLPDFSFSLFSWNILAPSLENDPKNLQKWLDRLDKIMLRIMNEKYDIVCLNEFDEDPFPEHKRLCGLNRIIEVFSDRYFISFAPKPMSVDLDISVRHGCLMMVKKTNSVNPPIITKPLFTYALSLTNIASCSNLNQIANIMCIEMYASAKPIRIILVGLHLKSGSNADARKGHMNQILEFLSELKINFSTDHSILMGDFNSKEIMKEMQDKKHVKSSSRKHYYDAHEDFCSANKNEFPCKGTTILSYNRNMRAIDKVDERLDYFLFSTSLKTIIKETLIKPISAQELAFYTEISDHVPIECKILFKN